MRSDIESQEARRKRINALHTMISNDEPSDKERVLCTFMRIYGNKKTTVYEYLGILMGDGSVVENNGSLYTREGFEAIRKENERALIAKEELHVKVNRMDAYIIGEE